MGQHFASLGELFGMNSEGPPLEARIDAFQRSAFDMSVREETDNLTIVESNGNLSVLNDATAANQSNKQSNDTNVDSSNADLENHNSRFECIYSQPIDQDSKQPCGNGNFITGSSVAFGKLREACRGSPGSSNSGSSSEDNPANVAPPRRSSKTLSFGKRRNKQRNKDQGSPCNHVLSSKKKRGNWVLKFNCAKSKGSKNTDIPGQGSNSPECVCTGYRRTEEHPMGAGIVFDGRSAPQSPVLGPLPPSPVIDLSRFNPEEFPMEDCDERARLQRAREMEEGVEPPPGYRPSCPAGIQMHPNGITVDSLAALFQAHAGIQAAALTALSQIDFTLIPNIERPAHTQIDYVHCLVPDLQSITACSFYWGKMDRYEAERLLEGKQEGTFLLRDSAQEEFLFSVCGLIEHYKDPSCCMFFEPMLTIPLHRNFAFPLQHLCRAVVTTRTTYDGINKLQLPKTLKSYLKEYHYKQRVRVRRLDTENDVSSDSSRSVSYQPLLSFRDSNSVG